MNWYLEVLRKYAVFDGRARRKEYWYRALFSSIISIVLTIIDGVIGTYNADAGLGLLSGIYTLAVLIPIIGAIVLFVFVVQDSKPCENQYGSNPKSAVA